MDENEGQVNELHDLAAVSEEILADHFKTARTVTWVVVAAAAVLGLIMYIADQEGVMVVFLIFAAVLLMTWGEAWALRHRVRSGSFGSSSTEVLEILSWLHSRGRIDWRKL